VLHHTLANLFISSESFTSSDLDWNFTNTAKPSKLSSKCDSALIFGGHQLFKNNMGISRSFNLSSLPHQNILIEFDLFLIDFWDGQSLLLKINSELIKNITLNTRSDHYYDLCGNFTYDSYERISVLIPHVEPYLVIEIVSDMNGIPEGPERSWGIRDLSIELMVQCQYNTRRVNSTACECETGFYTKIRENCPKTGYENNFCFDCAVCPKFCKLCSGANTCSECDQGFTLVDGNCQTPDGKLKLYNFLSTSK
jgi:hypothetical protein